MRRMVSASLLPYQMHTAGSSIKSMGYNGTYGRAESSSPAAYTVGPMEMSTKGRGAVPSRGTSLTARQGHDAVACALI